MIFPSASVGLSGSRPLPPARLLPGADFVAAHEHHQFEGLRVEQVLQARERDHHPAAAEPDLPVPIHLPVPAGRRRPDRRHSVDDAVESSSSMPSFRFAMRESAPCRFSVGVATIRAIAVVTRASEMPDDRLGVASTEDGDQLERLRRAGHRAQQPQERGRRRSDRQEGDVALEGRPNLEDRFEEQLPPEHRVARQRVRRRC